MPAPTAYETTIARIRDLADLIGNRNDGVMQDAAANIRSRKPAFWSNQKYHNAQAGILLAYVNRHASISEAADAIERAYGDGQPFVTIEALDWLIPLNRSAVSALAKAYAGLGTFRARDELQDREAKVLAKYRDEHWREIEHKPSTVAIVGAVAAELGVA